MAQGRKTGRAADQTSASERRPPRLPEPEERTGDRTADALLDLRDHVAAARAAMDTISAERLSEAVQGTVRADTRTVAHDLHTATQNASQAATAAQEAAQAINRTPSRALLWIAALGVALAVLAAGTAGWFGRAYVGPEIGLALPTCAEPTVVSDENGITFCVVARP